MLNYDSVLGDFLSNIIAKWTTNGIIPQKNNLQDDADQDTDKGYRKIIPFKHDGIHDRYSAYQKIYYKSLGTTLEYFRNLPITIQRFLLL